MNLVNYVFVPSSVVVRASVASEMYSTVVIWKFISQTVTNMNIPEVIFW